MAVDFKKVLYFGDIILSDFYRDIDQGISLFFQAGYHYPLYALDHHDRFVLNLSPKCYYALPIIEIVGYFLAKKCLKNLSVMSLTVLHEAISNSLLWGLLKVERPNDIFEFHRIIEEKLSSIEGNKKTICIAVQDSPSLKIKIINPYDEDFDFDSFKSNPSPYIRGGEVMRMFSHMSYNKSLHTLELMFGDMENVYQAVAQS